MAEIKVSTDSVSDLNSELLNKYNIPVFPLIINLGNVSKPDYDGMSADIYAYVEKSGKTPKTAARGSDEYLEFFRAHKPEGGELIHFSLSKEISASYNNACEAAKQIEGVYVVNTESLSTGSGLSVLYCCDLIAAGNSSAKEIYEKVQARAKNAQASFVIDSLDFLYKGGRCSGVSLLLSNILSIKPVIMLKDGKMVVGKKFMNKFEKAVDKYVNEILNTYNTPDLTRCFITYTTAEDHIINAVKEKVLARYPFKEFYITRAGGTITSHCGKNTLGILYFNDGNKIL